MIYPCSNIEKYISLWKGEDTTAEARITSAVKAIKDLKPGKYLFIDHPGLDTPEMRAIWHTGYEKVAADRDAVTKVFTSREVIKAVREKGVRLVSYKETHIN